MIRETLGKYRAVFSIGLQNTFVYRWNFLLRSLFALIPLFGTVFVWRSIYGGTSGLIAGYDFGEMVFYFLVVLLVDNLITPTEDEWQIAAEIREGQLSSFLLKPFDFLAYRSCIFIASRLLYTAVALLPVAGVFCWYREYLQWPTHASTWIWFGVSLVMAGAIQFLIAYSLAMLAFWILEISTVVFILYSFEYFLSGKLFPLDAVPGVAGTVLRLLPFPYELYFPVAVLMEKIQPPQLWSGLLIQATWVLLCFLLARGLWRAGIRRYEAVGI
ncbi:MAG: ABC transporter permease [Chthoniobacterales bacterium]|nr:ABC-2 family transporter protein [Verrucomicrobiota bacterium]